MNKYLKALLICMMIWAVYHTIRDIFQVIFQIHHPLVDILHFSNGRSLSFLGPFWSRYWEFPLEIPIFFLSLYGLKSGKFIPAGVMVLGLYLVFFAAWVYLAF